MSFLEIGMLVGFGAAWPMNIYKSLTSRTAAGRSLTFQWAIIFGYVCGIIHKLIYSNDVVLYLLYFRTGISPHKTPSKPVSTPLERAMI